MAVGRRPSSRVSSAWRSPILADPRAACRCARADEFGDAIKGFASSDYGERIAAVEKLAALGDPRAVPLLQALDDGALVVRKPGTRS